MTSLLLTERNSPYIYIHIATNYPGCNILLKHFNLAVVPSPKLAGALSMADVTFLLSELAIANENYPSQGYSFKQDLITVTADRGL